MCIPCGPRGGGFFGRVSYNTLEDCLAFVSLETARKDYPDDAAALAQLISYAEKHCDHTFKWCVNELYDTNRYLLRIGCELDVLKQWKKAYNKARKAWKEQTVC